MSRIKNGISKILLKIKLAIKKEHLVSFIIAALSLTFFGAVVLMGRNINLTTRIRSANDLDLIRENLGGNFLITNDISMSSYIDENGNQKLWEPIGTEKKPFTGRIDFNNKQILDLAFSDEYIIKQIEKDDNHDVLIGFLGYSEGTIIHAKFYCPVLPTISNLVNNPKKIVYGTACAKNYGYVTSCAVTLLGKSGSFKGTNFTFGTLVGENHNQLLNDYCVNTININCGGRSLIGGIVGETFPDSKNNYLVRMGYTTINVVSGSCVIVGGIAGLVNGGNFENVFHGGTKWQRDSLAIRSKDDNDFYAEVGGLIGSLRGEGKVDLKNGYCCNRIIIKNSDSTPFVGGLIGYSSIKSLKVQSCVADSSIDCNKPNANRCGTFVGFNDRSFVSENSYYLWDIKDNVNYNVLLANKSAFEELTLEHLKWPTSTTNGYWKKENNVFQLVL